MRAAAASEHGAHPGELDADPNLTSSDACAPTSEDRELSSSRFHTRRARTACHSSGTSPTHLLSRSPGTGKGVRTVIGRNSCDKGPELIPQSCEPGDLLIKLRQPPVQQIGSGPTRALTRITHDKQLTNVGKAKTKVLRTLDEPHAVDRCGTVPAVS